MDNNVLWLNKLVPKHVLLDNSEIEKRLKPLQIEKKQLPKILLKDPALKALDQEAKPGDVVKFKGLVVVPIHNSGAKETPLNSVCGFWLEKKKKQNSKLLPKIPR